MWRRWAADRFGPFMPTTNGKARYFFPEWPDAGLHSASPAPHAAYTLCLFMRQLSAKRLRRSYDTACDLW